ncbi:GFA family protein [Mesorhizobium sp.]|uniref:GFA family protein n=1 Tax=Mesorhizobium sp. TaxID=1871066 RepID=UPI00257ECCE2|nr:GFA family protein [Mesorhizobium sp.]
MAKACHVGKDIGEKQRTSCESCERISAAPQSVEYRTGSGTMSGTICCPTCACVLAWRGLRASAAGRTRIAVNVRLAPPDTVVDLLIDHFDGLLTFEDLPRDGRCVRDMWF